MRLAAVYYMLSHNCMSGDFLSRVSVVNQTVVTSWFWSGSSSYRDTLAFSQTGANLRPDFPGLILTSMFCRLPLSSSPAALNYSKVSPAANLLFCLFYWRLLRIPRTSRTSYVGTAKNPGYLCMLAASCKSSLTSTRTELLEP